MEKILINANRNGYSTRQCGSTLSVGELIAILEEYDADTPVYLSNDNGYTYGSITEGDLNLDYDED